jgi:hypothetical protein
MSFVRGAGFEPTTSLPGNSIEAFPSDATTAPFPSLSYNLLIFIYLFILSISLFYRFNYVLIAAL